MNQRKIKIVGGGAKNESLLIDLFGCWQVSFQQFAVFGQSPVHGLFFYFVQGLVKIFKEFLLIGYSSLVQEILLREILE